MDRTADVLHLGLSVRPEWDPQVPVHWSNIHVDTIASRQFSQLPGWATIASKIADIVRQELALAHVMQFRAKLNQITPGHGYLVDAETRAAMVGNITMATTLSEVVPSEAPSSLPSRPINSSPSLSSLPSRHPSSSVQGVMPKATYVRVTSFSQEITEADTPARAGEGSIEPANVPAWRLTAGRIRGASQSQVASSSRIQAPASRRRPPLSTTASSSQMPPLPPPRIAPSLSSPVSPSHPPSSSSSHLVATSAPTTPHRAVRASSTHLPPCTPSRSSRPVEGKFLYNVSVIHD